MDLVLSKEYQARASSPAAMTKYLPRTMLLLPAEAMANSKLIKNCLESVLSLYFGKFSVLKLTNHSEAYNPSVNG